MSSSKKSDRLWMIGIGAMFSFIGIRVIFSGRLIPRHGGGPPLEGPAATIAGVFVLATGIYLGYRAFTTRPDSGM
jgi:hypothetical protein